KFLGDCLIDKLKSSTPKSKADLGKIFQSTNPDAVGKWLDIAGLLVPEKYVNSLLDDIETGKLATIEKITESLKQLHSNYSEYKWAWACEKINNIMKKHAELTDAEKVLKIIESWSAASKKLTALILADAEKEFADVPRIGFGVDGDEKTRDDDFDAVRGTYEGNSLVKQLKKQQEVTNQTAEEWKNKIKFLSA
ncbi:MAG: DUF4954 family protein, partial [Planctomycetes bacterium]|nr:DUF4954 family protein [Planctomycetota bacterium]